jgi:hypothetical protein
MVASNETSLPDAAYGVLPFLTLQAQVFGVTLYDPKSYPAVPTAVPAHAEMFTAPWSCTLNVTSDMFVLAFVDTMTVRPVVATGV